MFRIMPDARKIALIIGVDTYYRKGLDGKPSLPQLPSSKNDAIDFSNLIGSEKFGFNRYPHSPIIGSDLDRLNGFIEIHRAIKDFFNNANIEDILLFYFSGHGIRRQDEEVYLATPQVDPKDPLFEGFRLSDLTRLVNSSRAREIVCIIDSCYSGAANLSLTAMSPEEQDDESAKSAKNASNNIVDSFLKKEGRYFFLSTQSFSKSYAPNINETDNSNSYFTKYLIAGLKGVKSTLDEKGKVMSYTGSVDDNGNITPESLHQYVSYNVIKEVSEQEPVLKSIHSRYPLILAEYPDLSSKREIASNDGYCLKLLIEGKIAEFNRIRQKDGSDLFLRDANLVGLKLVGVCLVRADLTNAILSNADLSQADLSYANLEKAHLNEANLTGQNLFKRTSLARIYIVSTCLNQI